MRSVTRSGPGDLTGPVRTVRAVTSAAVMLVLAVGAHAAAGGMAPGPWVTGTVLVLVGVAARPLTGRERGPVAVTAVTAAAQLVLHVAFGLSMESGRGTGAVMTPMQGHLLTGHGSGWMVTAHTGAGLAAAWWLRRGEAWAWLLVLLLAGSTSRVLRWPMPGRRPHAGDPRTATGTIVLPSSGAHDLRPSGKALTGGPLRRRGPPRVTRAPDARGSSMTHPTRARRPRLRRRLLAVGAAAAVLAGGLALTTAGTAAAARSLGGSGLVVGVLGLVAGAGALLPGRRRGNR